MNTKYNQTVLIVGDNKENFLNKTIKSCIIAPKTQIILIFYRLNNILDLKKSFGKKVKFVKIKKKINNPVKDQINKIRESLKFVKSENIFLCDGDDSFKKNKVNFINKYIKNNQIILHDHVIFKKSKLIYSGYKLYKNNIIYKILFNNWPDKIATSCIIVKKKALLNFFKFYTNNYNLLAIDALLIIFYKKEVLQLKKVLTIKNEDSNFRVDLNYTKSFEKYILRRIEQHKFNNKIHNEKNTLEFYLLKLINSFLFFLKK